MANAVHQRQHRRAAELSTKADELACVSTGAKQA